MSWFLCTQDNHSRLAAYSSGTGFWSKRRHSIHLAIRTSLSLSGLTLNRDNDAISMSGSLPPIILPLRHSNPPLLFNTSFLILAYVHGAQYLRLATLFYFSRAYYVLVDFFLFFFLYTHLPQTPSVVITS